LHSGISIQAFAALLTTALLITACDLRAQQNSSNVGDIAFDAKRDNSKFQFCNPEVVVQEYELKSSSDESNVWISGQLKEKFVHKASWGNETGFITIRFAVNCFGLTDRFRAKGVGADLKAVEFSSELTDYLIRLVKEIKWLVKNYQMKTFDYYQDVTFKIVKGKLQEVVI